MKNYTVTFGSGDPRGFTGLAPTFLTFYNLTTGTTNAPPSIAETIAGKTGVYTFQYGVTQAISFLLDAATTSPGANGRYVTGQIDPSDRADEYGTTLAAYGLSLLSYGQTLVAIGTSTVAFGGSASALGSTIIAILGTTSSSVGTSSVDPTTVLGFLMRALETGPEGNQTYTKTSGTLAVYNRGTTLMKTKTITDTTSTTTKT